mgnify:CR=1 FL=1
MKKVLFFIFTLLISCMNLHAKWFDVSKKVRVFLNVPNNYTILKDKWGVPLMLYGPKSPKGGRISLSVMPTPYTVKKFDKKELKSTQGEFREARKRHLSKVNGEAVKFFPYEVKKWKGVKEVHTIGYQFKLKNILYTENSFYFQCNNQFFVMKSLYRENSFGDQRDSINNLVSSFKCGKR